MSPMAVNTSPTRSAAKSGPSLQLRFFRAPGLGSLIQRFLLPVMLAYFAGFFGMGKLALQPSLREAASKHIPISPAPHGIQGPELQAARDVQSLAWHYLTHVPESCGEGPGRAVNDYQRLQCKDFWDRLERIGWIAAIPFGVAGLVFFVFFDGVRLRFSRARKRLASGESPGRAIVTEPALAPMDFVSWWLGVTPITVQGAGEKQLVVYLPPEMPLPDPGSQVTLYEWGKIAGKNRYFAVLYAPHLAVLQGT